MTFQRGGSYHAGFLRGKVTGGHTSLFSDDDLAELKMPGQIKVLWRSTTSYGVDGYIIDALIGDKGTEPFFVPMHDEVRYNDLRVRQYVDGLKDGLLKRASEIRIKRTQAMGA